jgi:hypothetical protein
MQCTHKIMWQNGKFKLKMHNILWIKRNSWFHWRHPCMKKAFFRSAALRNGITAKSLQEKWLLIQDNPLETKFPFEWAFAHRWVWVR